MSKAKPWLEVLCRFAGYMLPGDRERWRWSLPANDTEPANIIPLAERAPPPERESLTDRAIRLRDEYRRLATNPEDEGPDAA